jgi:signal transduction histidine kinase
MPHLRSGLSTRKFPLRPLICRRFRFGGSAVLDAFGEELGGVRFAETGGGVFRELPNELQEALVEAEVVGVTPIVSPRRRWGCGFITTGVLRASFTADEIEAAQALAGQFALLLDAAELLERARSVERSLAHSEKLAAIGELAARVAHEIRNPVTAARSLAQQLVRAPHSPMNVEHAGLILDVELPEGGTFDTPIPTEFNAFVWMLEGEASVGAGGRTARRSQIAVLGPGGGLRVTSAVSGTRFMLMAGKPYGEDPIYNGPYVD